MLTETVQVYFNIEPVEHAPAKLVAWTRSDLPQATSPLRLRPVVMEPLVASWIVFQLNDLIGRRHELRVGSILYVIGASIAAVSGTTLVNMIGSTAAISLLIGGRLIFGFGIGFTMHGVSSKAEG